MCESHHGLERSETGRMEQSPVAKAAAAQAMEAEDTMEPAHVEAATAVQAMAAEASSVHDERLPVQREGALTRMRKGLAKVFYDWEK